MVALEDVVAVLGTYLVLAAFLAVTTHVAARNVMGDVRADRALQVGPLTAAVPFPFLLVFGPQAFVPLLVVPTAVAVDATAIRRVYELDWKLAAYVTFIHAVVSVILGTVLGALSLLILAGGPGAGTPSG